MVKITTKVKIPNSFEKKNKAIEGKILTYTPHTGRFQTLIKQPKMLRKKRFFIFSCFKKQRTLQVLMSK